MFTTGQTLKANSFSFSTVSKPNGQLFRANSILCPMGLLTSCPFLCVLRLTDDGTNANRLTEHRLLRKAGEPYIPTEVIRDWVILRALRTEPSTRASSLDMSLNMYRTINLIHRTLVSYIALFGSLLLDMGSLGYNVYF